MKSLQAIALGLGLLVVTAAANAQGTTVRANIPFSFVVGNQPLPAGEYEIKRMLGNDILAIQDSEGNRAVALTLACESSAPSEKTELVFHRVGPYYFLWQVRTEGSSYGRQFQKGRMEAEEASNQKTDNVVILAELTN